MGESLAEMNDESASRIEELTSALTRNEEELEKMRQEKKIVEQKKIRWKAMFEEQEKKTSDYQEERDKYRSELVIERNKSAAHSHRAEAAEEQAEENIHTTQAKVRELEMRCTRLVEERQRTALELRAEQEKLDASNEELRIARQQVIKLSKIEGSHRDATEQLSQLRSVAERVTELQWENEQLNNQVSHLAAELEKKRDEVEDHQHHIEEQNDKIELMETRMRKFKLTSDHEPAPVQLVSSTPGTPRRAGAPASPRSGGSEGRSRPRTLADELRALGASSRRVSLTQSPLQTPTGRPITQPPSPMAVVVTSPSPAVATLQLPSVGSPPSTSSPVTSATTSTVTSPVRSGIVANPAAKRPQSFAALDAAAAAQAAAFASSSSPVKTTPAAAATSASSITSTSTSSTSSSTATNPSRRASDAVSLIISPSSSPMNGANGGEGSPVSLAINMKSAAIQQSLAAVASIISVPIPQSSPIATLSLSQSSLGLEAAVVSVPATSPVSVASTPTPSSTSSIPVTSPPSIASSTSSEQSGGVTPTVINGPVVPGTPGGRPTMLLSPGPALSPAAQKERDADYEFFALTLLAVKIDYGHRMGGDSTEVQSSLSAREVWLRAREQGVPFHHYHRFIETEVAKAFIRSAYPAKEKSAASSIVETKQVAAAASFLPAPGSHSRRSSMPELPSTISPTSDKAPLLGSGQPAVTPRPRPSTIRQHAANAMSVLRDLRDGISGSSSSHSATTASLNGDNNGPSPQSLPSPAGVANGWSPSSSLTLDTTATGSSLPTHLRARSASAASVALSLTPGANGNDSPTTAATVAAATAAAMRAKKLTATGKAVPPTEPPPTRRRWFS